GKAREADRLGARGRLVDVHLGEDERALMLRGEPLQQRPEGPAGPAPWRPEVDDHGGGLRSFQHRGLEVGIADLDHPLTSTHGQQPCAWSGTNPSPSPDISSLGAGHFEPQCLIDAETGAKNAENVSAT